MNVYRGKELRRNNIKEEFVEVIIMYVSKDRIPERVTGFYIISIIIIIK